MNYLLFINCYFSKQLTYIYTVGQKDLEKYLSSYESKKKSEYADN